MKARANKAHIAAMVQAERTAPSIGGISPGQRNASTNDNTTHQNSGFSLLELLVVLAIIVILTTLYWGSNSGSRQKQMQVQCENNLQKIYIALELFANEHELKFPEKPGARISAEPLDSLVPRYTSDTSLFICPASKDGPLGTGELQKQKISYAYYMGWHSKESNDPLMSDKQVNTQSKIIGQPVFSTNGQAPGNNHGKDGGNVLFCDGHVQASPPQAAFLLTPKQSIVLLNP
jgi:prepilin-type N-terminal cleavage/methylation domain-containing protein/prepilin-type processing-associated H-X9-DG protein